jgi:membrane associated rhomboid family serine protease
MLIIPLNGKLSIHNLPAITILIILINCAVYFGLQSHDHEYEYEAYKYYSVSGLEDMELGRYITYRTGEKAVDDEGKITVNKFKKAKYLREMMRDEKFQSQLVNGKIIVPDDPQYGKWKEMRGNFDFMRSKAVAYSYGFIPAKHETETFFTHMFLHGSIMHLFGNMIFLWLVGCVLELGFGRLNYLVLYILGGLCAVGLYYVFNMNSEIYLVGASGAIAGLMGAYTVAYGKRKINVFYSVGFYFNYTQVYAILLLPIWLANELFQLFFMTGSNVAYMAHIGGLIGGAALGFLNVRVFGPADRKVFEEDPKNRIVPLMEKAMQKIEALDMKGAKTLLTEVLAIDKNHMAALKYLYNIEKIKPSSDEFQKTAVKRINLLAREEGAEQELFEAYREYARLTDKMRIPADLLLHLCAMFARAGMFDESEKIIGHVLSVAPNHPQLPKTLLEAGGAGSGNEMNEGRDRMLRILLERFPQSPEAAAAGKTVNSEIRF